MANRIQLRRGLKSKLPTGSEGEPLYTIDTRELFIGTGNGNVNMNGSKWYTGTAMSGTTSTENNYNYAGCPLVKVGDMYLNTSYGYVYECTTAGSGTTAKWTYKGSIKGATGATGNTGAKGDKGERGAVGTVVIAASNSTAKSKAAADYVCDGTSDQSKITSALAALPSGGGKIVFAEGTYNISAAFAISKPVVFEGMGDGTQFNVSDALATCSATGNIVFRDMKITANTISKYLYKGSGNDDVLLDNVTITMTAKEAHHLALADTYAAFLGQRSFNSYNSDISLMTKCNGGVSNCFAVAENTDYQSSSGTPVRVIGGSITLEASNGNAHVSRNRLICNAVDINYKSSTADGAVTVGDSLYTMIIGCRLLFGDDLDPSTGYMYQGGVTNSVVYSDKSTNANTTVEGSFVNCRYHNIKLPSSAVLCNQI